MKKIVITFLPVLLLAACNQNTTTGSASASCTLETMPDFQTNS